MVGQVALYVSLAADAHDCWPSRKVVPFVPGIFCKASMAARMLGSGRDAEPVLRCIIQGHLQTKRLT